ncbi:MAG: lipoyl(octanoyl) transferase LipB [Alphaproteobacteria bacterium]|nr:lipoyl(octanoyl) transferase LipB [Alphaproteobacteria bacterium]
MGTSYLNSKPENIFEWKTQEGLVGYEDACKWMKERVFALQKNSAPECVWFLEHPPLYTLGTSGQDKDILGTSNLPLFRTGRGGQATYHGPGQRVIYLMLDLKKRHKDIRWYVRELEEWIIHALSHVGVKGERRAGRIGIWVNKGGQDHKIAALGVRVQKWVTSHGISLNVNPDLSAYQNIIPCGLSHYGVTSLADLGISITMEDINTTLYKTFPFNP